MRGGEALWRAVALLVLAMLVHDAALIVEASYSSDTSYYAGVVEFEPALDGTAIGRMRANKQKMIEIIESKETDGLDILVFPEYVLNNKETKTFVPSPDLKMAPCDAPDYDFFLTELSCAVRGRRMYVVVNVAEKALCINGTDIEGPCDDKGMQTFNTNVVFDRNGRIISRYRKTHLYGYEWYSTNVLRKPEVSTFTTDFGVTFGHFICFDMLFYVPAMRLVKDLNITDFIYPTYWYNELPFLTAIQLQEGWAFANDVTLLAAGGSVVAEKNSGSGIYAGRFGRLQAVITEQSSTTLLKTRVPKHLNPTQIQTQKPLALPPHMQPKFVPEAMPPRFKNLSLLRDYNVDIFTTVSLPLKFLRVTKRVCHNDFCCDFSITRELIDELDATTDAEGNTNSNSNSSYHYRLGAYSGQSTTFQRVDRSDQTICAIFACTAEHLYTCGHIFPAHIDVVYTHYFSNLTVSAGFPKAPHRLIMPSSVDGMMLPLSVESYTWKEETTAQSKVTNVTINLLRPKTDLLAFGIWANYYTTAVTTHNLDFKSQQPTRSAQPELRAIESGSAMLRYTPLAWLITVGSLLQLLVLTVPHAL